VPWKKRIKKSGKTNKGGDAPHQKYKFPRELSKIGFFASGAFQNAMKTFFYILFYLLIWLDKAGKHSLVDKDKSKETTS